MVSALLASAKVLGVLKTIGGVALAIVILLAMITIHEFGHYIAGRLLGFKINEFAVGFGPAILKKRSKKTGVQFSLRVIPLGGYCAFDGEDYDEEDEKREKEKKQEKSEEIFEEYAESANAIPEGEKSDKIAENKENDGGVYESNESATQKSSDVETDFSFDSKPSKDEYPEPKGKRFNDQAPWKRIIVLLAGATMNYLLALTIIIMMFACIGRPVYQVQEMAPPAETTDQTAIESYNEGLQTGDVILKIEGKTVYMITDFVDELNGKKKGETVDFLVLRDGKKQTVKVELLENANFKNMSDTGTLLFSLGIATRTQAPNEKGETVWKTTRGGGLSPDYTKDGFFETIGNSFMYSFKIGGSILRSIGELITGKMPITNMGGPVTTIKVTSQAASNGLASFLNIAAFIGVNLAVFNLLPVPALDGCKIIFCLFEWIFKKRINRKAELIINLVGIVFLFGFAILVDVLQFIL